jgi:hypothetical protein
MEYDGSDYEGGYNVEFDEGVNYGDMEEDGSDEEGVDNGDMEKDGSHDEDQSVQVDSVEDNIGPKWFRASICKENCVWKPRHCI